MPHKRTLRLGTWIWKIEDGVRYSRQYVGKLWTPIVNVNNQPPNDPRKCVVQYWKKPRIKVELKVETPTELKDKELAEAFWLAHRGLEATWLINQGRFAPDEEE